MMMTSLVLVSLASVILGQGVDTGGVDPFHFQDPFSGVHSLSSAADSGSVSSDPFFLRDPLAIVRPTSLNKVQSQADGQLGSVTSQVQLPDSLTASTTWIDPLRRWEWKREDSIKVPVAGPLYAYGQMNAGSSEMYTSDAQLAGKTGLACKLPVWIGEVQVRSGPAWSCSDPLRPMQMRDRAEWQMELQARCPLIWGAGIELQGQALPALSPLDRDKFNQDIHLALPICNGGKLNFGAKRSWEAINGQPILSSDTSQIYMGIQLTH